MTHFVAPVALCKEGPWEVLAGPPPHEEVNDLATTKRSLRLLWPDLSSPRVTLTGTDALTRWHAILFSRVAAGSRDWNQSNGQWRASCLSPVPAFTRGKLQLKLKFKMWVKAVFKRHYIGLAGVSVLSRYNVKKQKRHFALCKLNEGAWKHLWTLQPLIWISLSFQ